MGCYGSSNLENSCDRWYVARPFVTALPLNLAFLLRSLNALTHLLVQLKAAYPTAIRMRKTRLGTYYACNLVSSILETRNRRSMILALAWDPSDPSGECSIKGKYPNMTFIRNLLLV